MDSHDNLQQQQIQFTVNKTAGITYIRLDFYFANNIYNRLIKDNGQQDPDFEFIEFEKDAGINNAALNIRHVSMTGRGNINTCISLDICAFTCKYKGHLIKCRVDVNDKAIATIDMESRVFTKLYLSFENNDIAGVVFSDLIKSSLEYTEKYMNDCGSESTKLNIYGNDDGYWEKVLTKRKRAMDTIYLPKKDKQVIIDDITWFLMPETKSRYDSLGRTHKRVYLFEGVPGSGKTSFVTALASKFGYDVALITFTDKVTDGVLMRLLKNMPDKTILVLEDIDVLFNERKKNDEHKNHVTFSGILNTLDGITTRDGFICIMTTNYKNVLDTALLRPGRVDKQLEFKTATREQIQDIFIKFMDDKYTPELFREFYSAYKALGVEANMSLIQEYLFKYMDNTDGAISNVSEIKTLYAGFMTSGPVLYS